MAANPGLAMTYLSESTTNVEEKSNFFRQSKNFADPGPPPDGGWIAWRQVVGGFLVVFTCWGFINSFGLFQTYYASQPDIDASASDISWIGTLQIFLLMFIGAYSGSASDSGYFRLTSLLGIFLYVLGIFLTSICRQYYQLVLAHGVCVGIGNGLIFIPTMSVVATYFSPQRRSLALGLILCGSAVGGIILPVFFDHMLLKVGFGWTMRAFGFIALGLFGISQILLSKRLPPKDSVRILDFEALKDKVFILFMIAMFLNFLGVYFGFFYVGAYARNILGLTFSRSTDLLLAINGAGIPGRLGPMWLADQRQWKGVRPVTIMIPVNLMVSVMTFVWIAVKTERSAYVWAVFYGFMGNALQSFFPATLADMNVDPRKTGAQIGWGFTIGSFSCLIGVPIAGLLVQADGGTYRHAQIYAGTCSMCGFIIVCFVARMILQQQRQVEHPG